MLIQVRTDNHIENSAELAGRIQAEVEGLLRPRFADQLRRVEVYVQDVNGQKGGIDKRCSIEAHLAGLPSIAVHESAATIDDVVSGSLDKMARALERTVARLSDRGGRVSMSGDEA